MQWIYMEVNLFSYERPFKQQQHQQYSPLQNFVPLVPESYKLISNIHIRIAVTIR